MIAPAVCAPRHLQVDRMIPCTSVIKEIIHQSSPSCFVHWRSNPDGSEAGPQTGEVVLQAERMSPEGRNDLIYTIPEKEASIHYRDMRFAQRKKSAIKVDFSNPVGHFLLNHCSTVSRTRCHRLPTGSASSVTNGLSATTRPPSFTTTLPTA